MVGGGRRRRSKKEAVNAIIVLSVWILRCINHCVHIGNGDDGSGGAGGDGGGVTTG